MKFSVFTVSIPDLAPADALQALKSAGYEGVEWRVVDQGPAANGKPGFWSGNLATWSLKNFAAEAAQIRTLTAAAGLAMPSVGTYARCDETANVELAIAGAARLGARQLRINVPVYDGKSPYLKARDRALCQYREVEDLARRHGVRALIEIHMGTIAPSASAAAAFVRNFDPAWVGVIYDCGNMVYEGFEQYRMGLELLGPYLAHVHVKSALWQLAGTRPDGNADWKPVAAPFHKGIVDFTALFRALREVGYDGWISCEDFSTEEGTQDKLRRNIALLRQALAAAQA